MYSGEQFGICTSNKIKNVHGVFSIKFFFKQKICKSLSVVRLCLTFSSQTKTKKKNKHHTPAAPQRRFLAFLNFRLQICLFDMDIRLKYNEARSFDVGTIWLDSYDNDRQQSQFHTEYKISLKKGHYFNFNPFPICQKKNSHIPEKEYGF